MKNLKKLQNYNYKGKCAIMALVNNRPSTSQNHNSLSKYNSPCSEIVGENNENRKYIQCKNRFKNIFGSYF